MRERVEVAQAQEALGAGPREVGEHRSQPVSVGVEIGEGSRCASSRVR